MHQVDHDSAKGVYRIDAADEVTQHLFIGCMECLPERNLLLILERLLASFPFVGQRSSPATGPSTSMTK